MKPCFFLLVFTALIITAAPSEARSRSRHSSGDGGDYSGGGSLSRDRGISSVEADEIGAVVNEIAHSPAPPKSTGAPQRKRSADYYRVYSRQRQVVVTKSGKPGRAVFRPKTGR